MIKTIRTLNLSFSLPSRHHHKGQPLFTISSHLRRRVCYRRHTGNVPNTSLALHGKLQLALLAACAGCCTRACANCCMHNVRCWLREQHVLAAGSVCCKPRAAAAARAARCCCCACSALVAAAARAARWLLLVAAVKIFDLRRSDMLSMINLQIS